MRGHEPLIAMRKAGRRPACVFLNDFLCQTDWPQYGDSATVSIHGDAPETLDLRFLVGMTVSVLATDENRARTILEACKAAGAEIVAIGCARMTAHGYVASTMGEIWRKS